MWEYQNQIFLISFILILLFYKYIVRITSFLSFFTCNTKIQKKENRKKCLTYSIKQLGETIYSVCLVCPSTILLLNQNENISETFYKYYFEKKNYNFV